MKQHYNAETLFSTFLFFSLFTILLLSYNKWKQDQTFQLNYLYQEQQALQIADNQISLKMAEQPCESRVIQNNLTFNIECQTEKIKVRFPLGQVEISSAKKP